MFSPTVLHYFNLIGTYICAFLDRMNCYNYFNKFFNFKVFYPRTQTNYTINLDALYESYINYTNEHEFNIADGLNENDKEVLIIPGLIRPSELLNLITSNNHIHFYAYSTNKLFMERIKDYNIKNIDTLEGRHFDTIIVGKHLCKSGYKFVIDSYKPYLNTNGKLIFQTLMFHPSSNTVSKQIDLNNTLTFKKYIRNNKELANYIIPSFMDVISNCKLLYISTTDEMVLSFLENELKKYDNLDNNYIFLKRIHVFERLIREKLSIVYLVYEK